jgi:8-oxo-dGTP diphosphatase
MIKEILLIKGPKRGWEMPGGQVEIGESIITGAIREVPLLYYLWR